MTETLTHAMTAEAREAEESRAARRRWTRTFAGIGILAALATGGWWGWKTVTAPAIQLLAVLPASNMTRDPEQDPFVDGVHEELVTELQRAGIDVIARQSVLRYRDTDMPVRQIASELGVDALIQPRVAWEGDSVIVDVSILEASSQLSIFSQTFVSRREGVLGLFRAVSAEIADAIGAVLSEEAETRLAGRPTVDPQVMEYVLLGKSHLGRFTPQDFDLALDYFQAALEIDSLYAPAHVGVAEVWGYRAQRALVHPSEARGIPDRHLGRALDLDPDLAMARCFLAERLFWLDWEYDQGMEEMVRCLELDPNDARSRAFYGHMLMIMGRSEEALEQGERAVQLDRRDPFVIGLYGTILGESGPPEEAIQVLEAMFEDYPGAGFGYSGLARAYSRIGLTDEAARTRRASLAIAGDEEVVAAMDSGMEAGGGREAHRRAAEMLSHRFEKTHLSASGIAVLFREAGEVEKALEWLERALEQHELNLPYIGLWGWEELYEYPRFQAVIEEVGVPLLSG
jgi:TolB-like protein/tetratricopeptide (TPR) repeat protein